MAEVKETAGGPSATPEAPASTKQGEPQSKTKDEDIEDSNEDDGEGEVGEDGESGSYIGPFKEVCIQL